MSEFEILKAKLVSQRELWEDNDFPASSEVLATGERWNRHVRWLRPWVSQHVLVSVYDYCCYVSYLHCIIVSFQLFGCIH